MSSNILKAAALGGLLAFAVNAAATPAYDNGAPDNASPNGTLVNKFSFSPSPIYNAFVADDFVLSQGSVLDTATFFTFERLAGGNSPWDGSLVYAIFDNGPGVPGSNVLDGGVFASGVVQKDLGEVAGTGGTWKHFSYTFDLGGPASTLNLGAGTYWLGLYAQAGNGAASDPIFWQTTSGGANTAPKLVYQPNPIAPQYWITSPGLNGKDLAFHLSSPVPIPGTLLLLSLGLAGLSLRFRRNYPA